MSRYSRTYSGKVRMYGRFKASSGGLRSIDAYKIGKGINSISISERLVFVYRRLSSTPKTVA